MPFMCSESCSFIWQPKVVTWNCRMEGMRVPAGARNPGWRLTRGMHELAATQYGVVTLADLAEAGLDTDAVARRVADGRLHRLHRGVYAVGHTAVGQHGRWLAAVYACGEG